MQSGKPGRNFAARTIWTGDNLDILRGLNSETVDLIYLDPPFNSNRDYAAPIGSKAAGAAFKDTWTLDDLDVAWLGLIADRHPGMYRVIEAAGVSHSKGLKSYLCMMAVRLLEMHRVLAPSGSIYLHCDPVASHYLKLLMDAIFGKDNYRNEVIWHYKSFHGNVKRYFPRKHDVLFVYNKSTEWTFNRLFEEDNTDTIDHKRWFDYLIDGRYIFGRNMPTQDSRFVRFLNRWIRENGRDPGPNDVVYEVVGQALDTVWDIKPVDPKDKRERIGYPTQKPLALLERVIRASSNVGDVVLDPFCGCATACVAADNLQREWIGIDISPKAVELVRMRLRDALGGLYHAGMVTERADIPMRTDIEVPIPYRLNKHVLFGQQEGLCAGCRSEFPYRAFEVDHVIPQSRGGTDHIDNLQLLCSSCNRIKGNRTMEYLMARLAEFRQTA